MPDEPRIAVSDVIYAELVDCTPEPEATVPVPVPAVAPASPVQKARHATIEQTGADPPPGLEWEVWLRDGSTVTSREASWADVPDGILVVVVWDAAGRRTWTNWDDGVYGRPDTWKAAAYVDDITFNTALREAQAPRLAPSRR